jgi:hypothetical protein
MCALLRAASRFYTLFSRPRALRRLRADPATVSQRASSSASPPAGGGGDRAGMPLPEAEEGPELADAESKMDEAAPDERSSNDPAGEDGGREQQNTGLWSEHHLLVAAAAVATGAEAAAFAGRKEGRGGHPMVPKLGPREAGKGVAERGRRGRGKVPHVGAVVEEVSPRPNPNHEH